MSSLEERLKLLEPAPASDGLRTRIAFAARRRTHWARTVPMAAAAAGLIAVLIFSLVAAPGGKTSAAAEADFRKMEETLKSAKSLRVRFRREAAMKDPEGRTTSFVTSGTMLLKEGNRLRFDFQEGPLGGSMAEFLIVADGRSLRTFLVRPDGLYKIRNWGPETPSGLLENFALALARESIAVPGNILEVPMLGERLTVSDFSPGEPEIGLKTILYKVEPFNAQVWIDPKRNVPVKRVRERKELGTFTETYDEITLNPDLADDVFRIPEVFKIPEGK